MNSRVRQSSFPENRSGQPSGMPYSDTTVQAIGKEVRSIVDAAYQRTFKRIRERRTEVEQLANDATHQRLGGTLPQST
jgi:ATP-dependent Zn protease